MGKIAIDLSDVSIFTSDNPRSEDPDKIIFQMKTIHIDKKLLEQLKSFYPK
jgi:UDP-N-acetylmuramyl tripeptide synthase